MVSTVSKQAMFAAVPKGLGIIDEEGYELRDCKTCLILEHSLSQNNQFGLNTNLPLIMETENEL